MPDREGPKMTSERKLVCIDPKELATLRAKAEAFDAVAEQLDSKFVRDVADRLAAIKKEYGDD